MIRRLIVHLAGAGAGICNSEGIAKYGTMHGTVIDFLVVIRGFLFSIKGKQRANSGLSKGD